MCEVEGVSEVLPDQEQGVQKEVDEEDKKDKIKRQESLCMPIKLYRHTYVFLLNVSL